MLPTVGARVTHPRWGGGVITRLMDGGRVYLVTLDDTTPIALPARQFTVDDAPGEPLRSHATSSSWGGGAPAVAQPATPPPVGPRAPLDPPDPRAYVARRATKEAPQGSDRQGATDGDDTKVPTEALGAAGAMPPPHERQPNERADARQALEALRLGVVPPQGLSRLTVGRDVEQRRLRTLAEDARGMVVLSGGYGAGKTHLVELAEAEALAANMLVARATFDPEEVPPSHPLRVYAALMTGLRYPEGTGRGLAPLLDRLAGSKAHAEPNGASAHRWFTPALWAHARYGGGRLAADLLEWAEGAPQIGDSHSVRMYAAGWTGRRPLALPDYRTFGQIMAYLLGGIAAWAKDAGWRGLLVLLDEAEYFDHLDTTARGMAENVLRYLAIGALPDADLPFDPTRVYRGGQAVHQGVPARFREDQPLAVMCAFTPNPRIDAALPGIVKSHAVLHLEPVHPSAFPRLADNVLQMVREAHPDLGPSASHQERVKKALAEAWEDGRVANTRQAARMLVEHWDLYRFEPARALRALQPR